MELRTQTCRESVQSDIVTGKTDLMHGHYNMICGERNASCQRIGFLLGHATAFRLDTEMVNRARNSFAGHHFGNQGQVNGVNEVNGGAVNGEDQQNGDVEMNGVDESDGSGSLDTPTVEPVANNNGIVSRLEAAATTTNGVGGTNGNHRGNGMAVETVSGARNTGSTTAVSGSIGTNSEEESGGTTSPPGGVAVHIA